MALATSIALGIGLHNLGEGLAIGAAFATGAAALGSFLVLGFTLHNVTEGVGIVAPLVGGAAAALASSPRSPRSPACRRCSASGSGAYAFAPHWAALCFGVGAGAILQVIVEVGAYLQPDRPARRRHGALGHRARGLRRRPRRHVRDRDAGQLLTSAP